MNVPSAAEDRPEPLAVSSQPKWPYDRQELYQEVWKAPLRSVAKEYGVSDVALGKTCKKLHVPVPGKGYWEKAAQRPSPPQPILPNLPFINN